MTLKRAALRGCAALIPNLYRPPAGVLFPAGHIVSESAPPHVRHLLTVPTIRKFRSDLDFLCQRYKPLQLAELNELRRLPHTKASPRTFLLSFDDGLREVYEIIAPTLQPFFSLTVQPSIINSSCGVTKSACLLSDANNSLGAHLPK
jgi:hypothetical protein